MRDFIEEIFTHFTANSVGVGYAHAKDISFESPDAQIAVYETLGLPTGAIEKARIRTFQVVVRAVVYEDAHTVAWDAFDSLTGDDGFVVINTKLYKVVLMQSPFKLKVDEQQRVYFAFNFLSSIPL